MRISVIKGLARVTAVSATAIVLTLGFVAAGAGAEPGDNGNGANASASAQGQPSDTGKPDEKGEPRSDRGNGQSSQGTSSQGTSSSEDTNSPQPPSNADYSGNGANTHGPYDSTRDGSPSQNGNGDGKAKGKPCAGCVGKADNKNPPGQMPGGSDPNAGYECDTNNGVGKSNPAHTSCQEQPPGTTPPGTTPPETTPPETTPPETSTTTPPTTTDTTPPETSTQPAPTAPGTQPPAGGEAPEAAPEALPTTGVSAALPVLSGLAAVLIGGVLLLLGRRWASAREH
ncbi:hypothetical protein [Haloechinothrix halophila]|uniref:hypothetical protein n=1 Tax=Haloechinothrix halophila TaxID=1069073 RepID=UPI00041DB02B|nr:hypothetical protein [Haloechinothrix halophila]